MRFGIFPKLSYFLVTVTPCQKGVFAVLLRNLAKNSMFVAQSKIVFLQKLRVVHSCQKPHLSNRILIIFLRWFLVTVTAVSSPQSITGFTKN